MKRKTGLGNPGADEIRYLQECFLGKFDIRNSSAAIKNMTPYRSWLGWAGSGTYLKPFKIKEYYDLLCSKMNKISTSIGAITSSTGKLWIVDLYSVCSSYE